MPPPKTRPASTDQKIILATIDCIDKYGVSGATNRKIARMAGVNLAAINYYFRSKNALIQRCMEVTLHNAFDLTDLPSLPGVRPEDRCIAIMMHLVEGGFRFPGLSRAHFSTVQAEGRYHPVLVKHLNRFIDELAGDLRAHGCALETHELELALIQIVSAVMQLILAPDLFKDHHGMNFRRAESCRAYVSRIVNKLLA